MWNYVHAMRTMIENASFSLLFCFVLRRCRKQPLPHYASLSRPTTRHAIINILGRRSRGPVWCAPASARLPELGNLIVCAGIPRVLVPIGPRLQTLRQLWYKFHSLACAHHCQEVFGANKSPVLLYSRIVPALLERLRRNIGSQGSRSKPLPCCLLRWWLLCRLGWCCLWCLWWCLWWLLAGCKQIAQEELAPLVTLQR